ncbi:MAG TPA: hypothetical protein DCW74_13495, partial [Alteromonas australica]|nr:hypothetical protein [Alteromonas australica]
RNSLGLTVTEYVIWPLYFTSTQANNYICSRVLSTLVAKSAAYTKMESICTMHDKAFQTKSVCK